MRKNRLFKGKYSKISYLTQTKVNIQSLGILSYGGLFISIKIVYLQNAHLTGFFKSSQVLQQNSEPVNAQRITKSFCL